MTRFSLRGCMLAALIVCLSLAALAPFNCAWAQAAAPGTTIDLSPLVQGLLALLSLTGTAVGGLATTWLYQKLGIQKNSAAAGVVNDLFTKGGALAYSWIASRGARITTVDVKNAAIAAGVNLAVGQGAKEMALLGISPEAAATHVEAELGKLLAVDPTVSIAGAAAAPALDGIASKVVKDVPAS